MGAPYNPIPLVKTSLEQFWCLRLLIWKAFQPSYNLIWCRNLCKQPYYINYVMFLDAIASPSTYHCQWVGQWVSDSFRFVDSYRIFELCKLVNILPFVLMFSCSRRTRLMSSEMSVAQWIFSMAVVVVNFLHWIFCKSCRALGMGPWKILLNTQCQWANNQQMLWTCLRFVISVKWAGFLKTKFHTQNQIKN